MNEFSKERKGFNKTEVNKFISDIKLNNEKILKEQAERINLLRLENKELKEENEKLLLKEQDISKTLITATQKAQEIKEKAKNYYKLQIIAVQNLYEKYKRIFEKVELNNENIKNQYDNKELVNKMLNEINKCLLDNNVKIKNDNIDKYKNINFLIRLSNISLGERKNKLKYIRKNKPSF